MKPRHPFISATLGVVSLVLGALAAVVGAFLHPSVVQLVGIAWPTGLAVAFVVLFVAVRFGSDLTRSRAGAVLAFVGWLVTAFILSLPTNAGDVVIPGTWWGYAFLIGGMVTGSIAVWTSIPLRPRPRTSDEPLGDR